MTQSFANAAQSFANAAIASRCLHNCLPGKLDGSSCEAAGSTSARVRRSFNTSVTAVHRATLSLWTLNWFYLLAMHCTRCARLSMPLTEFTDPKTPVMYGASDFGIQHTFESLDNTFSSTI